MFDRMFFFCIVNFSIICFLFDNNIVMFYLLESVHKLKSVSGVRGLTRINGENSFAVWFTKILKNYFKNSIQSSFNLKDLNYFPSQNYFLTLPDIMWISIPCNLQIIMSYLPAKTQL